MVKIFVSETKKGQILSIEKKKMEQFLSLTIFLKDILEEVIFCNIFRKILITQGKIFII